MKITADEQRAIAALKRVATKWPKSLWLFSASGTLCVMKCDADGKHAHLPRGAIDPDYRVDVVYGIPNDGGDF